MPKQNGNPKILAAGAAVQLLTGIPAAWGVFQKPVMAQYGFSRGQAMLSFAILVAGYGIGCAIGGFVQDQHGPRYAALWGTALLGGGSMGAALVPQGNAALFFLVYSIPAGVGSAFLAPAVLACAQKWYASRKGLATGVSGAAMGLSGAFLTVFVGFVENRWGMRVCFAALGVVVLAVCGASAAVLQNPPQPAGQPNAKAANDLPPHQMVRTTQYRLCVAGVALAAPPMLLFSPEILTIAADRGLPEQWAPLCVAVGSAASAAGRLLCPAASDHWGRKPVLYGVYSAGKPYYYSTVGNEQAIAAVHAIRLTGGMDEEEMAQFCREKKISLLVDAAHPFAIRLHRTLAKVSSRLRIPVVRLERQYPAHDKRLIWCTDYAAAIDRLRADGICNLLALTGVKTIAKLRPYWEQTPCWFRILNRKESLSLAESDGFPKERIIFFHEGEDEKKLLDQLHPDAVLTKESGESGYFKEKVEAAQACGIPVYVIQRPPLPDSFTFVQGMEGLRKAIERLAPGFFPLRSGFTTGTCATAAAKAALVALLNRTEQTVSCITLPSGEKIMLPVAATEWADNAALCTVIKEYLWPAGADWPLHCYIY